MSAGAMATAAGLAVFVCALVVRKVSEKDQDVEISGGMMEAPATSEKREGRWPTVAPVSWGGSAAVAMRTVRFALSETFGKWPFIDLVLGVRYLIRQGNLKVSSIYGTGHCVQLQGADIISDVLHLRRLLTLCFLFTKRKFPVFLESAGYSEVDVLLQKPKGGFMKPAFAVVCDKPSNCIFLVVRGASSFKDRLTAAASAVVPFEHLVLQGDEKDNVVLGYAHCGMVAASRWIAKCAVPHLLEAVNQYPEYKIKIIGHSMGGGVAALLTCILREYEEFLAITCVAFGPAACMTWDLAESCKYFITTIVNNSDSVPSLSTASVDDFREEVVASSWSKEFRNQVPFTRFMNNFFHTLSTLGCCLPFKFASWANHSRDDDDYNSPLKASSNRTQELEGRGESCSFLKPHRRPARAEVFSSISISHLPMIKTGNTLSVLSDQPGGCRVSLSNDEGETAKDKTPVLVAEAVERRQLFPPGRIMHMVGMPAADSGANSSNCMGEEYVGLFETPRDLYSKVRLSSTMINDHYMPMYLKTIDKLLNWLMKDNLTQGGSLDCA